MIEAQFTYQKKLFTWTSLGAIHFHPEGVVKLNNGLFIEDATTIRDALRVIRSFCTGLDYAKANPVRNSSGKSGSSDPLPGSVSDRNSQPLANPANPATTETSDEL